MRPAAPLVGPRPFSRAPPSAPATAEPCSTVRTYARAPPPAAHRSHRPRNAPLRPHANARGSSAAATGALLGPVLAADRADAWRSIGGGHRRPLGAGDVLPRRRDRRRLEDDRRRTRVEADLRPRERARSDRR